VKVGDLVKKNFIKGVVIGIITDVSSSARDGCTDASLVAVMWPGCKPFWTSTLGLEIVNEKSKNTEVVGEV